MVHIIMSVIIEMVFLLTKTILIIFMNLSTQNACMYFNTQTHYCGTQRAVAGDCLKCSRTQIWACPAA